MSEAMDQLTFRPPVMEDAENVLNLMIACDIAAYGEPDSSLEDLQDDWADIDLEQDAWLVFSSGGQLVGYAAVYGSAPRFTFDCYTHPVLAPDGLTRDLLVRCENRAREMVNNPETTSKAVVFFPQVNQNSLKSAQELGYHSDRYHFGMSITLDGPLSPPTWPQGAVLRNIRPGEDDRLVYEFIQTAFERPGRTRPSFENWHNVMMEASIFNPDLWFLLFHRDELIGAALCFDYPQYGWVRQLGVSPNWRHQGIGSNLLKHVFNTFLSRGQATIALGVDAENTNARHLYESVGMKCARVFVECVKDLENI
jgi:ribosomal protein S18 acetylase RimI-like enzyme